VAKGEGGEICWELREKILTAIDNHDIKVGGKILKVRIPQAPEVEDKRGHFWRAVDALKKFAKEDEDFMLAPRAFGIHESKGLELLGRSTETGYIWDEAMVRKALPNVSILELKKAALQRRRKQ